MQRRGFLFALLALVANIAESYGVAYVKSKDGAPYTWSTSAPITYKVDPGDLGSILNADAKIMVADAFAAWANVPVASGLAFTQGSDIAVDVTDANIEQYVGVTLLGDLVSLSGDSLIIFDSDGSIFENFFGVDSDFIILGVATPAGFDDAALKIEAGLAIINGSAEAVADQNTLKATIIHEFGHFLNVGHSQVNIDLAANTNAADDQYVPTMFPYSLGDDSELISLHKDDESSVAYLYPNAAALATKGIIKGKIKTRSQGGLMGVYVVCTDVANPKANTVAFISDQDQSGDGSYECIDLEPGSYTIQAQPIFVAISIYPKDPPGIFSDFYNGAKESYDPKVDSREEKTQVAVAAGETKSGINIIMNEDGRLMSNVSKTGTIVLGGFSFDHFITVPKGTDSLTAELTHEVSGANLNFAGKCGDAFSYAPATSQPLDENILDGQLEFEGEGSATSKSATVDVSEQTKDAACDYHFMMSGTGDVGSEFELKITLKGADPSILVETLPEASAFAGTGETHIARVNLTAQSDTFQITAIKLKDEGTGDLSRVSSVKIYSIDSEDSEPVLTEDTLLGEISDINTSDKTYSLENISLEIAAGQTHNLLVVYNLTAANAGFSWPLVVLFLGIILSGLFLKTPYAKSLAITLIVTGLLSCGGGKDKGEFYPTIKEPADITAQGVTFGDQFSLNDAKGSNSDSVAGFFN